MKMKNMQVNPEGMVLPVLAGCIRPMPPVLKPISGWEATHFKARYQDFEAAGKEKAPARALEQRIAA